MDILIKNFNNMIGELESLPKYNLADAMVISDIVTKYGFDDEESEDALFDSGNGILNGSDLESFLNREREDYSYELDNIEDCGFDDDDFTKARYHELKSIIKEIDERIKDATDFSRPSRLYIRDGLYFDDYYILTNDNVATIIKETLKP